MVDRAGPAATQRYRVLCIENSQQIAAPDVVRVWPKLDGQRYAAALQPGASAGESLFAPATSRRYRPTCAVRLAGRFSHDLLPRTLDAPRWTFQPNHDRSSIR